MYTTSDERGILNNYAKEPTMYLAEYPSQAQQRGYLVQGVIGLLVIALTVFTAVVVS